MRSFRSILLFSFLSILSFAFAQKRITVDSVSISAAQFRGVGPAFMTGRISDVVIDPADESHWYVGVGSGGVWETKMLESLFNPYLISKRYIALVVLH